MPPPAPRLAPALLIVALIVAAPARAAIVPEIPVDPVTVPEALREQGLDPFAPRLAEPIEFILMLLIMGVIFACEENWNNVCPPPSGGLPGAPGGDGGDGGDGGVGCSGTSVSVSGCCGGDGGGGGSGGAGGNGGSGQNGGEPGSGGAGGSAGEAGASGANFVGTSVSSCSSPTWRLLRVAPLA